MLLLFQVDVKCKNRIVLPFRKLRYPTKGETENHRIKNAFDRGYVSSQEGNSNLCSVNLNCCLLFVGFGILESPKKH